MRRRIRYRFDNSLARGPLVLIGWLGGGVLAMILVAAVVGRSFLGGNQHGGFMEEFWKNRPAVVIMAPRDIAQMDADLRDRVGDMKNTRVACRSGDPAKPADLELVNARTDPSLRAFVPESLAVPFFDARKRRRT